MKVSSLAVWVCLPALSLSAQSFSTNTEQGRAVFRSNCAFCHGLDARGGRGPDLASRNLVHGDSDDALRQVILKGVPGSTMPAFRFGQGELASLLAYIRSIRGEGAGVQKLEGDPARGRQVYERSGCAACHLIGREGSVYGPDLSRIGAARSLAYLRDSIIDPSADVPEQFEGVAVTTKAGKRIRGIRVNEDTFTIQLRDPPGGFRMFSKDELQQVTNESKSLMPAYDKLPPRDLDDLLAYLTTLRAAVDQGEGVTRLERK